jgi:hypothetical protein
MTLEEALGPMPAIAIARHAGRIYLATRLPSGRPGVVHYSDEWLKAKPPDAAVTPVSDLTTLPAGLDWQPRQRKEDPHAR